MAMVRTIQHPGIQIQESEIGGYSSTVVMNNAYIMGFADRGPIYDYSWISTTKEFTKIYGEPQTEAEKYLFTAVQSVLANGGTPIVARMPYDNKQCKAYKAMKIKWGDVTPLVDTDLASPLVPLSAVAGKINMNRDFSEIFTTDSVTIDNLEVPSSYIEELTISQILKQLNPYKTGNAVSQGELWEDLDLGFKLNGVAPSGLNVDQLAVSSMIESALRDEVKGIKKCYIYDEGLNIVQFTSKDEIKAKFVKNPFVFEIHEKYLYVRNETVSGLINLFGDNLDPIEGELSGIPVYLPNYVPSAVVGAMKLDTNISSWVASGDIVVVPSEYQKLAGLMEFDAREYIVQGAPIAYFDNEAEYDYIVPAKTNQKKIYNKFNYGEIKDYVNFAEEIISGNLTRINVDKLSGFYKVDEKGAVNGTTYQSLVGRSLNDAIQTVTKTDELDTLYPLYVGTYNGYICDYKTGQPTSQKIEPNMTDSLVLSGFYNVDVESPAVSGFITIGETEYKVYSINEISGITWVSEDGNEVKFIDITDTKSEAAFDAENFATIKRSGSVKYIICYNVPYTTYLNDIPVVDIDDDVLAENESLIWIKTIYNNPKLMRLDEQNIAKLEASLMATPEMGFKYGLYLDSEDCEISNDQYDDLVTVNQFKAVDRSIDKYGQDIDDANFIIVDKQKTVVQGAGGNIGFFSAIIDPFDALKVQRTLVNPAETVSSERIVNVRDAEGNIVTTKVAEFDHSDANINRLDYWAYESADAWNKIYDEILDSMDCLQRVRNADGIYIGEPNPVDGKLNIMDSWSIPLTGGYYEDSISKTLMRKFPGIPMADISSDDLVDPDYVPSIIDHNFCTHIMVAVCKTTIDQTTGKIVVQLVETFFGSLFNEKNIQNGRSLFIGDIINANSDYIEFYRNNYVSAGEAGAYDPPEYRRTDVNQIFIKDSEDLKNAAQLRGIDGDDYGMDSPNPVIRKQGEEAYLKDLAKKHIYVIDKKEVCLYNLHWEANLTSFSKKESQKVIANTSGLYSVNDGTTINVAKNFLVDMDRCINFIKNVDDIQLHFVCDAGLSTIAQFCDNVVWNPNKMTVVGEEIDPVTKKKTGKKIYTKTGGWITQPFAPDDDPDGEDRYITGYEDVATWRKVVEKLDSIASEIRKDCFVIVDAPRQLTLDGAAPKLRKTKFTNNFDKTIGRCLRYITGFNSSYCAGYYNWLRTTDQYTGKSYWIPPTTKIIGNLCYLNIANLPWLAPAGFTYGIITGVHAVSHNPDYQEEDQIYMKSWNYIKQYPLEGFIVEGQRTMLGKESVFERMNVRLLFLDLERFTYNVAKTFKYQVNNSYTREQFVMTLKPKFEDYTLRGGIYEYLIKVDDENNTPESIDANELRGDIFIKPARLIEFILLNFVGTSTGTDFSELQLG
jgi:hypothetical protein